MKPDELLELLESYEYTHDGYGSLGEHIIRTYLNKVLNTHRYNSYSGDLPDLNGIIYDSINNAPPTNVDNQQIKFEMPNLIRNHEWDIRDIAKLEIEETNKYKPVLYVDPKDGMMPENNTFFCGNPVFIKADDVSRVDMGICVSIPDEYSLNLILLPEFKNDITLLTPVLDSNDNGKLFLEILNKSKDNSINIRKGTGLVSGQMVRKCEIQIEPMCLDE